MNLIMISTMTGGGALVRIQLNDSGNNLTGGAESSWGGAENQYSNTGGGQAQSWGLWGSEQQQQQPW